ncbi:MAG TPA: GtrA family protein [Bacteroidota bacterium]|nr:GtrA family protein [Bacteroidota bacterium]
MNHFFLMKVLKFGIVGTSGILIDYAVTYLIKERVQLNKYLANSLGFTAAATSNYILNRVWTFQSRNPHITVEYLKFFFIALIGLGISNTIIWYASKKTTYNFYVIKGFAIAVVFVWNFGANYLITFQQ